MSPKKKKKNSQGELLFEIGTEEIPASYLKGALASIRGNFLSTFAAQTYSQPETLTSELTMGTYQTPRRLVLHITGFRRFYEGQETISGPKRDLCYQPDGKPTKALEGFLRSRHASMKDLHEQSGRVVIQRTRKVKSEQALARTLPEVLHHVSFAKEMWWEQKEIHFARPIRWILCLLDGKPVPFSFGELRAGMKTAGIGPIRQEKAVRNWAGYSAFLRKEGILLEASPAPGGEGERKRVIRKQLETLLKLSGGDPARIDANLLEEVTNLVECPLLFTGILNRRYLALPREVLIASMAKYQRVFSVQDRRGKLLPYFVACANGKPALAKVKKNYEQVLNARLEDAHFFFTADTREGLSQKRERLKELVYHQKLGSMYEKSERMKHLASLLAPAVQLDEKALARACTLAKNDLVTEMVKEFPSLQGVVGCYYAEREGESEPVSRALWEQYLPKGNQVELPKTPLGSALSFLEKIDHLVGCFHAAEIPTGSVDPYGLRRAANALFRILLEKKWHLSLKDIIEKNFDLFSSGKEPRLKLYGFLKERLKNTFREKGYREDLIEAVVRDIQNPVQITEKLFSLKEMMAQKPVDFMAAFKVVERTHNILKPIEPQEREGIGGVRPDLFQDEIEKSLWSIYNREKGSIQKLIGERAWERATARYGEMFSETLHQFFDKVLINVEDRDIRRNRLAMMKEINELYTQSVADLSKLIMRQ